MNVKIGETEIEKKILFEIREDWLASHREAPIDPAMPIIDPHHHLWDRGARYLLEDIKGDIDRGGHNVRATVFSQCDSMYRAGGEEKFAPVGETEFVNGVAAMSASNTYGPARICAGIVGFADLLLGADVDAVLEAHLRAAGERFKGVRHCSVWDADRSIKSTPLDYPPQLLLDAKFRAGFARLARYGLSFDSLIYHTQIPELTDLAKTFPDTLIVLDHVGIPLGIGAYAGRHDEVFKTWADNIRGTRQMSEHPRQARRHGHAHVRFRLRDAAKAADIGGVGQDVAALRRNLRGSVRPAAGDVREQLPGGQALLQLRRDVERVQTARRRL